MTKSEMEMMLLAIGEKVGVVKAKAAPAPVATADDVKAKRLAGLEKARAAKAAKAAAAAAAPAPAATPAAKPEPKAKGKAVEFDVNAVNNSRKSVEVKGNGESLTVHFCEGKSKYLVIVGGGERLYVRSPATVKAFAWVLRDGAGCKAVIDAANGWLVG